MNAALAAQIILAGLEIYRAEANKPKDWVPGPEDWEKLRAFARRTPAQIKAEARERLNRKPSGE